MKTYQPKASDIVRDWFVIDAKGLVLGQLAVEVAHMLRGKHKPTWVPHMDVGDNIIIINAAELDISIKKGQDKEYFTHSGYPGGIKSATLDVMMKKDPRKVVEIAVKGMLPNGRLGRAMIKKLHVYRGAEHPHQAQQPKEYVVKSKRAAASA